MISNFKLEPLRCNSAELNQISNSERGVSLIITFFILVIILAVILSVSIILYSQIKIIRNIGDSVVAFYAAETGIEKTLYYDRYGAPENATGSKRGVCNICDNYETCLLRLPLNSDPLGCGAETCENCKIKYEGFLPGFPGKKYFVEIFVSKMSSQNNPALKSSKLTISSVGSYDSISGESAMQRAIELISKKDETASTAPDFTATAMPFSVQNGTGINITAENIVAFGHGIKSIKAHIQRYDKAGGIIQADFWQNFRDDGIYEEGLNYTLQYIGPVGVYYVDVEVCDNEQSSNCKTITIDNIL